MRTSQISLFCTSAAVAATVMLIAPVPDFRMGCAMGPESSTDTGVPCDVTFTEIGPGCDTTNPKLAFSP